MNLQQIPSYTNLIRNAFIADEGRLLASIDFSGQELRILSDITGDEVMHQIFTEGGDVHSTTGVGIWNMKHPKSPTNIETFQRLRKMSDYFGDKDGNIDKGKFDEEHLSKAFNDGLILTKDVDKIVKEIELGIEFGKVRDQAKTLNFATVYGTTAIGLADSLGLSEEEAEMFIKSYMKTYPGVARWIEGIKKQVREKMYVETILGRKRRFYPEVQSGKKWLLESAYRKGMNSPIQGSAADMTKKATIDLQPALNKYGCNLILFIHDELLIDIPKDLGMDPLNEFADIMCNAIPLKCGMKSDIVISEKWGQKMGEDEIRELFEGDE